MGLNFGLKRINQALSFGFSGGVVNLNWFASEMIFIILIITAVIYQNSVGDWKHLNCFAIEKIFKFTI